MEELCSAARVGAQAKQSEAKRSEVSQASDASAVLALVVARRVPVFSSSQAPQVRARRRPARHTCTSPMPPPPSRTPLRCSRSRRRRRRRGCRCRCQTYPRWRRRGPLIVALCYSHYWRYWQQGALVRNFSRPRSRRCAGTSVSRRTSRRSRRHAQGPPRRRPLSHACRCRLTNEAMRFATTL